MGNWDSLGPYHAPRHE